MKQPKGNWKFNSWNSFYAVCRYFGDGVCDNDGRLNFKATLYFLYYPYDTMAMQQIPHSFLLVGIDQQLFGVCGDVTTNVLLQIWDTKKQIRVNFIVGIFFRKWTYVQVVYYLTRSMMAQYIYCHLRETRSSVQVPFVELNHPFKFFP